MSLHSPLLLTGPTFLVSLWRIWFYLQEVEGVCWCPAIANLLTLSFWNISLHEQVHFKLVGKFHSLLFPRISSYSLSLHCATQVSAGWLQVPLFISNSGSTDSTWGEMHLEFPLFPSYCLSPVCADFHKVLQFQISLFRRSERNENLL